MKKDMIHMKPLKNIIMIGIMNNKIPHFLNWIWGIFLFLSYSKIASFKLHILHESYNKGS